MLLHLGNDYVINEEDIIEIFDLDTASTKREKEFFSRCEKEGRLINITDDIPKSAIICSTDVGNICYVSQLSTRTLKKRLDGKMTFSINGD